MPTRRAAGSFHWAGGTVTALIERFCSHINFIGRCLQSKVTPKGFRFNFHASEFSHSSQKYLSLLKLCAKNATTLINVLLNVGPNSTKIVRLS